MLQEVRIAVVAVLFEYTHRLTLLECRGSLGWGVQEIAKALQRCKNLEVGSSLLRTVSAAPFARKNICGCVGAGSAAHRILFLSFHVCCTGCTGVAPLSTCAALLV